MNTQIMMDKALSGLDLIGGRLEKLGITDDFNRHTVLAYIMAEQKHLEGELDSLRARLDQKKAGVQRARSFITNAARHPLKTTSDTVKGFLGRKG
ncbi:hypothetical protein [Allohahella marinimesophila]|uniref:Uncharacterized protein n=1 Tax=Allohahella marinimesophila TaxID=1054972 RepID=A0ABP7PI01_9GAMM